MIGGEMATVEERLANVETQQQAASRERKQLNASLMAQAVQLDRIIAILDTITRVRNFIAWLSPVFTFVGVAIGMKLS